MRTAAIIFFIAALSSNSALAQRRGELAGVTVTHDTVRKAVRVEIDGKLFTELLYNQFAKPVLYPVIGPDGEEMTRNYPIKKDVKGEAKDHPHHKSLWYTHGKVNDVDFWAEGRGKGKIVTEEVVRAETEVGFAFIESKHIWKDAKGKEVCRDTTILRMGESESDRFIEFDIVLEATEGEVVFQDTKEGTMGIRTHPALRLNGKEATGSAINSEGDKDKKLWGKNAKWVDYWGKIKGKDVGIAIFDHRDNPRHPTTWHARDYGLIAANPFGINDFQKKGKDAGDFTLEEGSSYRFRYYFLFHKGTHEEADIPTRYEGWLDR